MPLLFASAIICLVTGQKSIMQTPNSEKITSPQSKLNRSKPSNTESPDNVNKPAPTTKTLPLGTGSAELQNDEKPAPKVNNKVPPKRWTFQQLKATDGLIPLQYGTNKFDSQKGMGGFGSPRDVRGKHIHRLWHESDESDSI
ncbi:Calponin -like protein OV9M [Trichinella nelsoni]|uniref:Calponin-like protein OV9M n=1 Tax=Trichinella nelsoni TaxID=6336 RepID=A0A0V0S1V1_9BILA|nr:Calponin -like protein OV9M [Trichinella nelsoni]